MFDNYPGNVEGEMVVPGSQSALGPDGKLEFNTLDEPIKDTVVYF